MCNVKVYSAQWAHDTNEICVSAEKSCRISIKRTKTDRQGGRNYHIHWLSGRICRFTSRQLLVSGEPRRVKRTTFPKSVKYEWTSRVLAPILILRQLRTRFVRTISKLAGTDRPYHKSAWLGAKCLRKRRAGTWYKNKSLWTFTGDSVGANFAR